MFIGDFEKSIPWSQSGARGCRRFLDRVWRLMEMLGRGSLKNINGMGFSQEHEIIMNKTIRKVSQDYEQMKFNTAIAAMMSLVNVFYDTGRINAPEYAVLLILLNPVSPHVTEELWEIAGFPGMLNEQRWPVWDETKTTDPQVEIVVQINGKIKERLWVDSGLTAGETEKSVICSDAFKIHTAGKTVIKIISIPGKLVNIVVR
jgi:leucyl-tRNA synthetase